MRDRLSDIAMMMASWRSPRMGPSSRPAVTSVLTRPPVSSGWACLWAHSVPLPLLLQSQTLMRRLLCASVNRSPCLTAVALPAVIRKGLVGTFHITPGDRVGMRPSTLWPWVLFLGRTALSMATGLAPHHPRLHHAALVHNRICQTSVTLPSTVSMTKTVDHVPSSDQSLHELLSF